MLIEINGDTSAVEAIKEKVIKAVSKSTSIRTLALNGSMEVREIDSWTDMNDILQALTSFSNVKPEEIKVINIRKTYGESLGTIGAKLWVTH